MPFISRNIDEILQENLKCDFKFPEKYWAGISSEAIKFVMKLTASHPSERYSATEALKSDWIQRFCGLANKIEESVTSSSLETLILADHCKKNSNTAQMINSKPNTYTVSLDLTTQDFGSDGSNGKFEVTSTKYAMKLKKKPL